ncbi:bacteriocin immunity protein [Pseudomonas fluorescens]|uniref:bacteriocin immunity protein n=1 Tax=Pseudomonas fluorescens TaxID=294 RepID=UPI0012417ECE
MTRLCTVQRAEKSTPEAITKIIKKWYAKNGIPSFKLQYIKRSNTMQLRHIDIDGPSSKQQNTCRCKKECTRWNLNNNSKTTPNPNSSFW